MFLAKDLLIQLDISFLYNLHLITIAKFILSSISNGWLFSSYSELNVFKKILFVGEISNKLPNGLLGTNVYNTLEPC